MFHKEILLIKIYKQHLTSTIDWLLRSCRKSCVGSSATYTPIIGWSAPYPETTGYIIPTLLRFASDYHHSQSKSIALNLADWLISIQDFKGYWTAGLYEQTGSDTPSIFNTAQIIKGMIAAHYYTGSQKYLESATKASEYLVEHMDDSGQWQMGNYKGRFNPSYYTQVAWPMLEVWQVTGAGSIKLAAQRLLDNILTRRNSSGAFKRWGFADGKPAFTHTIAYTLRGFLESARILNDWETYAKPTYKALELLIRKSEFTNGRLPGAFSDGWRPVNSYTCLTGNCQIAICLMIFEERESDLRIINAATKLIDYVCKTQSLWIRLLLPSVRGAVAGSEPLWGRYMLGRYPNWAAKYHCDALMRLIARLKSEGLE